MAQEPRQFHATTVLCVRRDGVVALGGDGQVTLGDTVMKGNAVKIRRLADGAVLAGFAGAVPRDGPPGGARRFLEQRPDRRARRLPQQQRARQPQQQHRFSAGVLVPHPKHWSVIAA